MRKIIMLIIGLLGVVLAYFRDQFGLSGLQLEAMLIALIPIVVYIFGEARNDIERIKKSLATQSGKWTDPKFWVGAVAVIIIWVNQAFGLNLPVEIIITALTFILGLIFRKDFSTLKKAY